ncbi:hypothetical protein N5D28_20700 [Stutzerimonas stutzeri]|uniref:hypothetical protein n=1 Tax=Stutzerimonas stutzeri TaxID=316 RepID=UPI002448A346|nr:hypothetical protein [Stutzerimonas stutzeri]MDH0611303.1 hypothetical protein [Stutzerimonas stutzeri]
MRKFQMSDQPLSLGEEDLLRILVGLVRSPAAIGEEWDQQRHRSFLARLAQVVADECGGEVELSSGGQLLVRLNESSPEGGGIWAQAESETKPSALDALQGLLNVLVRDGDGGFFINQEAIAEVNHASAVAGQCPILLQGEMPDDAEISEYPRSEWLASGVDEPYEVWVDEQLSSHFHELQVLASGTVANIS